MLCEKYPTSAMVMSPILLDGRIYPSYLTWRRPPVPRSPYPASNLASTVILGNRSWHDLACSQGLLNDIRPKTHHLEERMTKPRVKLASRDIIR
jgi:hypothetical protein